MATQKQAETLLQGNLLANVTPLIERIVELNPSELVEHQADRDIFEYWQVSEYLASKLKERDEVVIEKYGFPVWGRTTTGQAIKLDGVIEEITEEVAIN